MTILDREKGDMVEFVEHGASLTEPGANEHKSAQESGTNAAAEAYKGDNSNGKVQWTVRKVFAAATLCGLYTSSQILLYFVGGILSFIVADIGGASTIAWVPTAYLIALSAVSPFVGYLEDLFGRRIISICGVVLLCLGCVLMGKAHTFGQAVASMSISGAGAAIGELTALAGISEIVPVKRRAVSVACITLGMIPFLPFVLYGQILATDHSWRSVTWLCLTYDGLVLIGLVLFYFPKAHPRAEGTTKRAILMQLDYLGGALSVAGVTLLLIALQAAGYTHAWHSAYVLAQLLIGLALLAGFIIWEWKGARYPMIPSAIFQGQRVVTLVYIVAFVAGMNFYSFLNLFPFTLQVLYNPGPIDLGLKSFGFALGVGLGVPVGDALLGCVRGQVRIVLLGFAVMMTAFLGALAATNPTNSNLATILGAFGGLGCGGILTPAAIVALIVVPDEYLATAAALSLSIRGVGGAIGYAIYSNIMNNKLATKLPEYVATYAIKAGLPVSEAGQFVGTFLTLPANASALPHVTPEIIQAAALGSSWAYAESLKYVWLSTIPFGMLAVTCCIFVPSVRKWETNRIRVQI